MNFAGRRLLVVEDEPIIGLALEDMLGERGAHVLLAERMEQAFAMLEGDRFDAAILDVNVHGARSYPLAEALAGLGIPYIFATGYGEQSHPAKFADIPTVTKPYSIADLEQALTEVAGGDE